MKKLPLLMVICMAYTIAFAQPLPDKWSVTPNNTKNANGRLWMDFPTNTNWAIYVYRQSDNKYITSHAPSTKVASMALPEGEYRITLNNATLENVQIKKGHDTKLIIGILDVKHNDVWYVYDETGKVYHSSGTKPDKLLLPIGTYTLEAGSVKEKVIVESLDDEFHPSVETDQWIMTYEGASESKNDPLFVKGLFELRLRGVYRLYKQVGSGFDSMKYCTGECPDVYPLPEGKYALSFFNPEFQATIQIKDIPVKANYKTLVKAGYIGVELLSDWAIYDESKQNKLAHGKTPRIVGSLGGEIYQVFYKDKFHAVKILNADTVLVDALHFDNVVKESLFDITALKDAKSGDKGRLVTKFPEDSRREFWVNNVHVPANPDSTYLIPPGSYQIKLNRMDIKSVPIKKGSETRIKAGYLQLGDQVRWYLYDINKTTILRQGTSGTGSLYGAALKMAIPQGTYYLAIIDSETSPAAFGVRIIIRDGETVSFN
jgi:hypothetical protein